MPAKKHVPNSVKLATPAITWRSDDLSIGRVETILGRETVEQIFAMPKEAAVARAVCRGRGAFDACERERYAAYRSLVTMLDPTLTLNPKP